MISLVNYGLGNILAFANIYKRLNIEVSIASTVDELARAEALILPGVGAFDWAMTRLNESGMRACLDDLVVRQKRPVLGVCVGMQMMANRSDEGVLPGLGWVEANVRKFDDASFVQATHLPHMGWNDVSPSTTVDIFRGLETNPRFYFLHSYYIVPARREHILAVTHYDSPFASAIHADNVFGVQFHPEKSHGWGVQLLKNFAEL